MAWASTDDPETAHVPLNIAQVERLEEHYFSTPNPMPLPVKIALSKDQDPMALKGRMPRISPVEIVAALASAAARAKRASASDETMLAWRRVFLTTTFVFVYCEGADSRHFAALQGREDLAQNFASMRFTVLMKILDVEAFLDRKARTTGKLSALACANLYRANVRFASSADMITDGFVDMAITVCSRFLGIPTVRKAIIEIDQDVAVENPLDSISKLQLMVNKGKTAANVEWSTLLLLDYVRSDALSADQVSTRSLQGQGSGGKGLVDLLLYKRDCRDHMLTTLLDSYAFPAEIKIKLREVTGGSIEHYRASCGYSYNETYKPVKKSFMAGWKKSACLFFAMLDGIVFSYEYDVQLRSAVTNRKDVPSMLESNPFADELAAIEEALEEEGGSKKTKVDDESDDESNGSAAGGDEETVTGIEKLEVIVKIPKEVSSTLKQKLNKFKLAAKHIVSTNMETCPETLPMTDVAKRFKESAAGQARGDPTMLTHRGVFYDPKVAGQSDSQPQLRCPSLRQQGEHCKALIKMVLQTTDDDIATSDLYFISDAGKSGNHAQLLGGFTDSQGKAVTKQKRPIHTFFDEESCKEQHERVRGFATINQMETVLVVSKEILKLNEHERLHVPNATNRGNMLGPLSRPTEADQWCEKRSKKKLILGKNGIIGASGGLPGSAPGSKAAALTGKAKKKHDDETEPVFWHPTAPAVSEEHVHGCDLVAGVDLVGGPGWVAYEFLKRRRPVFVVCLTQDHADTMTCYLEGRIFTAMQDQDNVNIYSPALVELLAEMQEGEGDAGDPEDDDGDKDKDPKGKQDPKAKKSKGKKDSKDEEPKGKKDPKGKKKPKDEEPKKEPDGEPKGKKQSKMTKDQLLEQIRLLQEGGASAGGSGGKAAGNDDEEESDEDSHSDKCT